MFWRKKTSNEELYREKLNALIDLYKMQEVDLAKLKTSIVVIEEKIKKLQYSKSRGQVSEESGLGYSDPFDNLRKNL